MDWTSSGIKGSLHESGLSFNPERHFVFTWEIILRIVRSRRIKISLRTETRFRFMYWSSYFFGDFSTYTFSTWMKFPIWQNNLYFGHNKRRFQSEFHSKVKSRSKYTWFRIEKWNELCSLQHCYPSLNTMFDDAGSRRSGSNLPSTFIRC